MERIKRTRISKKHTINLVLNYVFILWMVFLCTAKLAFCLYNDEKAIEKAKDFLNQGKYLEAIGIYEEVATFSEDANTRAKALFFIGRTYSLYLDQYETALKQFEKIMKVYPNTFIAPDALFNSGMVLFERENYKEANIYFTKYLNDYPKGWHVQSAAVWADSSKSLMLGKKATKHSPEAPVISGDTLRVLLKNKINQITISATRKLAVSNPYTNTNIYTGSATLVFSKNSHHLMLNGQTIKTPICTVSSDGITANIDGKPYRGSFTISAEPEGLSVVNNIDIENYLYGVVPKEMPPKWAKQALMAQAVAARTYALYVKEKSKDKPYDLESTTLSQVYGGYNAEITTSNMAIDETKGKVMTYDGKLIVAYFHSNSGGHTEDSKNVWSADIPYLKGVPDKFSENTPVTNWEYFLSSDLAQKRLQEHGINAGSIQKLKISGKSGSGRTLKILVPADNGISRLTSNNFRIKIGGTKIKSTLFQVTSHPDGLLFKGKGFGHGVGMSQWGARKMAQAGSDYENILKHYYQNIKITKLNYN